MRIEDAKVLVTGGSSGIGLETAARLIDKGARVAVMAREPGRLERAAQKIGALPIQADVSREDDVVRAVQTTIDKLGGYNVLINNAGFGTFAPLVEQELDSFHRVWATNVTGAMLAARESARHFVAQGGGHIVNVASTAASRGFVGGTAYVASKFALAGMTECWRSELRPHNVRVMLVRPSEVVTEFFATAGLDQAPSERKLRPDEIAHTILSLLEMDDRGFVTDVSVWATNPP